MAEQRGGLHLTLEAAQSVGLSEALRCDHFESDQAVEPLLASLVNHAHAAAVEFFENLETRQNLPGGEGWQRRSLDQPRRLLHARGDCGFLPCHGADRADLAQVGGKVAVRGEFPAVTGRTR